MCFCLVFGERWNLTSGEREYLAEQFLSKMLNPAWLFLTADSKIQTERLDLKDGIGSTRKQNLRLGKCSNYKNETTEGVAID